MTELTQSTAPATQPRILVADDQADVLVALELLLKAEGIRPDFARTPSDVVEAVRSRAYDLLLLDMNYGGDTTSGAEGLELLSRVRELDQTLPVVLMTAWGTVELAVEAMRSGSRDFVLKPWDNQRLLDTIHRNLSHDTEFSHATHLANLDGDADTPFAREVQEAHRIQQRLLPTEFPAVGAYELHGTWHPAAAVGGDYYDAIQLGNDRLAFSIGDVSGKGLPAALLMANVQATVRAMAPTLPGAPEICRHLNRVVLGNTPSEKFVTLFYGLLDVPTGDIEYSNAGHPPPILLRRDGSLDRLGEGGCVLGLFGDVAYTRGSARIQAGDQIVLYTDGLTEAENEDGEEFGEGRLVDLLRHHHGLGPRALNREVLGAVGQFAGRLEDDATLLTLRMNPKPAPCPAP